MSGATRSLLAIRYSIRLPKGERGARSALWLVFGLRSSSLSLAARFARPVANRCSSGLGLRSLRRWPPSPRRRAGLPQSRTPMHLRGDYLGGFAPPLHRLSHARSRPSRLDCPASNETSDARDVCILRPIATRSD